MSPSPAHRSPPTTVPTTNIIKNGIPLLPPIPAEPEASPSPPTSPILKPLRRPELQGIPGSSSFPINTQLYRLLSFPNPLSVQGFAASPEPICNIPRPALPSLCHRSPPDPSPLTVSNSLYDETCEQTPEEEEDMGPDQTRLSLGTPD